jgi:hypothetical protein
VQDLVQSRLEGRKPPWRVLLPSVSFRQDPRFVLGVLAFNAIGLGILSTGHMRVTFAFMLLPVLLVAVAVLADADGTILVIAALTLELTIPQLNQALPLGIGTEIFPSDVVVVLAVAAWFVERGFRTEAKSPALPSLRSPALGLPLLLFAVVIGESAVRGHNAYGASLVGRPLRMFLYAAIALAIVRVDTRRLYKAIVIAFYTATVWELLNAFYYMANGGSQSIAPDLSTGGTRYLSIAVSLYLSGTFFLALINLSIATSAGARPLHAAMLILSAVEIGLAFSRGTFITVGLLGSILFIFLRDVRRGALSMLPLVVPLFLLGVLFLARSNSTVIPTFVKRINPSITADQSVHWRQKANDELLKQYHSAPLFGVGFGKDINFTIDFQDVHTTQQAHNDFLYILAGSGIVGLASFLLVISASIGDALRRLRTTVEPHERALLLFASITAASFLLNGLVEPLITLPSVVLTIWTLMLLPLAVRPATAAARATSGAASPAPTI